MNKKFPADLGIFTEEIFNVLEWPVKLTVFRTTCNAKIRAGNLSNVLVEVCFMHLVCIVFICG